MATPKPKPLLVFETLRSFHLVFIYISLFVLILITLVLTWIFAPATYVHKQSNLYTFDAADGMLGFKSSSSLQPSLALLNDEDQQRQKFKRFFNGNDTVTYTLDRLIPGLTSEYYVSLVLFPRTNYTDYFGFDQDMKIKLDVWRAVGSSMVRVTPINNVIQRKLVCPQKERKCQPLLLVDEPFVDSTSYSFDVSLLTEAGGNQDELFDTLLYFDFLVGNFEYSIFELIFRNLFNTTSLIALVLFFSLVMYSVFSKYFEPLYRQASGKPAAATTVTSTSTTSPSSPIETAEAVLNSSVRTRPFLVTLKMVYYSWWYVHTEQKFIGLLLFGLILFNNPFITWRYISTNFLFVFINIIFHITFFAILLFTLWVIVHSVTTTKQERTILSFYFPKVVVIGVFWLITLVTFLYSSLQSVYDPSFFYFTDIPAYRYIIAALVVVLVVYSTWLAFHFVKALTWYFQDKLPDRVHDSIKFRTVASLSLILLTLIAFIYIVMAATSLFNNSSIFYFSFYLIFNFHIYLLAFFFLPSPHSPKEKITLVDDEIDETQVVDVALE